MDDKEVKELIRKAMEIHVYEWHKKRRSETFMPPTVEEVTDYAQQAQLPLNVTEFIDFYEGKGWMVGKVSMKDWRAAARQAARKWAKDLNVPWLHKDAVLCDCGCGRPVEHKTGAVRYAKTECRKKLLGW